MTTVTTSISNVAFSKTDIAHLNSLNSTEINSFPNPSNGRFMVTFKSRRTENLILTVREAGSGTAVLTEELYDKYGLSRL